ncbi:putative membrane protein YpjC [Gottschalkia acidurici 9a]|uniref:Membrane protein YpjC n=1 Tax=Gottschalkia acidurici (strain ATCC 7906 / DSM 604 / BCRC 14475 / CIP 104303 / KCTC 5404 / NCIMB 10678 / 9a) TaxID=1128398 RepID=K0AYT6_GOTA9|nr:YitT family protein [Gottschalkia acidurici]AFS77870.1 putative membrane protein YpjC [Gottschalkia acidurici 9a]
MFKRQSAILKNIGLILMGNTLYALAVTSFILPNGLITGGTTGLALLFYHEMSIPISVFVSIFNIIMFVLGAMMLGRKFALTTLISTFFYPFILGVFQNVFWLQDFTSDKLLSAIYAGILIGFSIGIVIKAEASTGGMSIPPIILNKKFGVSISLSMYVFDFLILISQIIFASKEQVLYGLLLVIIYTIVLDKVLLLGRSRTQVKIISKKYEEINEIITHHLDRGSTLIHAETGYCRDENLVVLTVVSSRELPKLNKLVTSIDPNAFMIISQVNEVKGRGFTIDKLYK